VRITTPDPGTRVDLEQIDLSATALYTDGDAQLAWQTLRTERPVWWNESPAVGGFWAVTRYRDVRAVLRDHENFTSERGTALDMIGAPDPAARRMMHATDPPCHQAFRRPLEQPLTAPRVPEYAALTKTLVHDALAPARRPGGWDAAAHLSRLPVMVMTRLMALPDADADVLLHAAYASVAPTDAHYRVGSTIRTLQWAHSTLVDYFNHRVRERQGSPGSDLLSHLVTMTVAGRPLTGEEAVLNCYSLLVGGVVTTAQVALATLIALAEEGGGHGRWPSADGHDLVEESLRWSSPTTHFLRHARRDVTLHDTVIRAGDPVAAWIGSANRDETTFERPYSFEPGRRPNRHLAFGTGAHRCVGRHLARLVLREVFAVLTATVESFELTGPPVHLASTLVAGVTRLPIRTIPHR
jgi:cytochrome P450